MFNVMLLCHTISKDKNRLIITATNYNLVAGKKRLSLCENIIFLKRVGYFRHMIFNTQTFIGTYVAK